MAPVDVTSAIGRPTEELLGASLTPLRQLTVDASNPDRQGVIRISWQSLCDAGITGVLAPVRHGGQGGGLTEAVSLARELTALGCSLPYLSSAVHATRLAVQSGANALLAELTTGDRIAAVATGAEARRKDGRWTVSGTVTDVLHGSDADVWLLSAKSERGWCLVEIDRPLCELRPGVDPTRPVVQAHLVDVPARLLQEDCEAALRTASHHAEVVRAAEVVAAAELVLGDGPTETRLLMAARSLIDFAAASTDVDHRVDADALELLLHWTSRVSLVATLASRVTSDDLSIFLEARAGQRSGWASPGPSAPVRGGSPDNAERAPFGQHTPTAHRQRRS